MAIKFGEFFANLDKNANVRGNQFERAAKWWLENDPVWSSIVDKVWHWNEWPDANGRDIGIDLVAKDREGKFYAVQVKAYDPESNLKKSDIDSFLSASSQKIFSTRLLLTTTKFIGTNAKRALEDQEKPVHVVDWNRLEASIVDWSGALADKKSDKTIFIYFFIIDSILAELIFVLYIRKPVAHAEISKSVSAAKYCATSV